MAVYEITNPSDPYTLEADDLTVAVMAVAFLGDGAYGLQTESGDMVVPIFRFGGADAWCQEQFGKTFAAVCEGVDRACLADCLDSVLIGSFAERRAFEADLALIDPAEHAERKAAWHDSHRSSLNDIGRRAANLAVAIRRAAGSRGMREQP